MFGSSKPSFFGAPATTSSAFGSQGFGVPVSTQQSTFGFGGTTNTGFSNPSTATAGGLFGQPASTSLFGAQQQSTAFGTNTATTNSGFGSIFGAPAQQQQPQAQQSPFFGGANKFGSGGSLMAFGATAPGTMQAQPGTPIKFTPLVGSEAMVKNGVNTSMNTRHQCITCMKEYETKSLEELRLEDYQANRKGPGAGAGTVFNATQATGTSLFNSTPQTGTVQPFNASANTSGLFNKPASAFGVAATTNTTSIFNQTFGAKPLGFSTQPTNSFGQTQPAPQASANLFGQPAPQTSTANPFGTTSLFQTPNTLNTQNQQRSLFSQPNTGQPQQTLFSQTAGLTNTGFGSKPNIFGQTTQAATPAPAFNFSATTTAPSLFSSQPQPSLFTANAASTANKVPMFNFNANPTIGQPTPALGAGAPTGTSLFNPTGSTGLFGSTSTVGNTNLFGTQAPNLGGASLFSNTLNTSLMNPAAQQQQQQVAGSQFKPNEMFLNRLLTLPYGNSPLFQSDLKENSLTPLKFTTDPKTLSQYKVDFKAVNENKLTPISKTNNRTDSILFDGLDEFPDEQLTAKDIFVPRRHIKKLILKPKTNALSLQVDSTLKSPLGEDARSNTNASNQEIVTLETTMDAFYSQPKQTAHKVLEDVGNKEVTSPNISTLSSAGLENPNNSFTKSFVNASVTVHPKSGIKCTRPDYYTIPSLEQIESLCEVDATDCILDSFTIGRHEYGSIFWEGPVDVFKLDLDEIVHIRRKEVIVYIDDETKPPVGEGLNKPAQVTLHKVWPVDKSTHEIIKDFDRLITMKYAEKVEKSTIRMGAVFMDYRPDTGSWVFAVKHFSKYKLSEDEDEEELVVQPNKLVNVSRKPEQQVDSDLTSSDGAYGRTPAVEDEGQYLKRKALQQEDRYDLSSSDMFDDPKDYGFEPLADEFMTGYDTPTYYNPMKTALFGDTEERDIKKSKSGSFLDVPNWSFGAQLMQQPKSFVSPTRFDVKKRDIVLKADCFASNNQVICDISSIHSGRSSRVRFFNGSSNFVMFDGFKVSICGLKLYSSATDMDKRFEVQCRENSILNQNRSDAPFTITRRHYKNEHNNQSLQALVECYYGDLQEQSSYSKSHEHLNRIIDWLSDRNRCLEKPRNSLALIIFHLASNDLEAAVRECFKSNHPRLALLIVSGDDVAIQDSCTLQLASWKESRADQFIHQQIIKIYVLLSRTFCWSTSERKEINVLDGLEWTQQLNLILLHADHTGLTHALSMMNVVPNVVEYHIVAGHSPWTILSAVDNELDSWFLHQSLVSYNCVRQDARSDAVHMFLCAQLMSSTVKWSAFVTSHIKNDIIRNELLNELLGKNASRLKNQDEHILKNWLLIPDHFISNAKALLARSDFTDDEGQSKVHRFIPETEREMWLNIATLPENDAISYPSVNRLRSFISYQMFSSPFIKKC